MNKKTHAKILLTLAAAFICLIILMISDSRFGLDIFQNESSGIIQRVIFNTLIILSALFVKLLMQKSTTKILYTLLFVSIILEYTVSSILFILSPYIYQIANARPILNDTIFSISSYIFLVLPIPFLIAILIKEGFGNNFYALGFLIYKSLSFITKMILRIDSVRDLYYTASQKYMIASNIVTVFVAITYLLWAIGAINISIKALKKPAE